MILVWILWLVLCVEGWRLDPQLGMENLFPKHKDVDEGLDYYLKNHAPLGPWRGDLVPSEDLRTSLTGLDSCCIYNQDTLVYSCKGCSLSEVPTGENIPATTRWVDLSNNLIAEVPAHLFSQGYPFTSLLAVDFNSNVIRTVDPDAFSTLDLTQLILSNNFLRSVPQYLPSTLDRLGLIGNRIDIVDEYSFTVRNNSNDSYVHESLTYLSISTRILGTRAFSGLPNLEEIVLETCDIRRYAFQNFPILHLWLRDICSTFLDTERNGLILDRYAFAGFPGTALGLLDTFVREIPWRAFAEMNNLETLHISGINMSEITHGTFFMLPKVRSIHVTENYPSHLVALNEGILEEGMNMLSELWFSKLNVISVQSHTFDNIPQLAYISLSENVLSGLSPEVLEPVEERLGLLDLSFNPWNCDCALYWLVELLWRHQNGSNLTQVNPEYTMCASPPELSGRRLDELTSGDFDCNNRTEPRSSSWFYPY